MNSFQALLHHVADGGVLTSQDAETAIATLMSGDVPDAQIAGFLTALKVRGEHVDEVAGGARALRKAARKLKLDMPVLDCCGTGGDGAHTFNISTAAAIIAAGGGARIAKHGNRAVSSKSGSSDVLAALGLHLEASADQLRESIGKAGIGFLFAPRHHSAMRHVAPARQALGYRTLFNMLGPLSNPAGARRQLIGVYEPRLLSLMGRAALALGAERVMTVHGDDGLDELSLAGHSTIHIYQGEDERVLRIHPGDVGLKTAPLSSIAGGDAQTNADALRAVLNGAPGPHRDICVLNAGAILWLADLAPDLAGGVRRAADSIDQGHAARALTTMIAISRSELS